MANRNETAPDKLAIEEASEFWDTHSVADYPSRIVELNYAPEETMTFIAIADPLHIALKQQAKKCGISVETLVNQWIAEKLAI